RVVDETAAGARLRQIRGQDRHSAADLLDLRTQRFRAVRAVRVVDRDVRALSRELARDPVADARSAAGDERAAAGERKTHRRFAPIRIKLFFAGASLRAWGPLPPPLPPRVRADANAIRRRRDSGAP